MEYGKEAHLDTEVLGIARDGPQSLSCGTKEQAVTEFLVLQRDRGDFVGQGEDDVKVGDIEKVAFAGIEPLGSRCRSALGAVTIATGVVGDLFVTA